MASEDSNRSVADYFVVAGLPQKNPQLLDECSLEVNLKNGAYQDPITDIAVRVPTVESVQDFLIKLGIKPRMHILEIVIFLLNHVIFRPTKIMNNLLKDAKLVFSVIFQHKKSMESF